MAEAPNIQYARPIEIDYRPFQLYLQRKEANERNRLAQERLNLQEQAEANRMAAQRQANIDKRLKSLSGLNKYGTGGLFGHQISNHISAARDELAKKIMANDPSWQQDLASTTQSLNNLQNKAEAYGKLLKQKVSDYSKNKAIDPGALRNFLLNQTAFDDNGELRNLSDIDLTKVAKIDPLMMPGADEFINNAEATDQLMDLFPMNTTATSRSNRADGVTNSTATTMRAPDYVRINPATGKRTLNVEAVGDDPILRDKLFDEYRDSDGKVRLIKEPFYETAKQNPIFRSRLAREIQDHNQGLQPGDPDYIEPNSREAGLVGRALLTQNLTGRLRGDFRITRKHAANKNAGGPNTVSAKKNLDLVQKFKGVMDQNPDYLKFKTESRLPSEPLSGTEMGNIVDVTPLFKDFNVGTNEKNKPIPAQHIVIHKDDPGKLFVDYGDGSEPEEVTLQYLPTWLNNKAQFNKKMDAEKLTKNIQKVFGDELSASPSPPANNPQPDKTATPLKRVANVVRDTIKTVFGGQKVVTRKAGEKPKKTTKKHRDNPFG